MDINYWLELTLPGGIAGLGTSWLFRTWLSERLKQSISHEYSAKLENLKNSLNGKLELIKHQNEVQQLRTSLFFEHQRTAFAEILSKVAETNETWSESWEQHIGIMEQVPIEKYRELKDLYYKHQLFLDAESLMAMDLLFDFYTDSFPFMDGEGMEHDRDVQGPYDNAEYVRPRLAALFQQKIGVAADLRSAKQLAQLGAIQMLNKYHFPAIDIPVRDALEIGPHDGPADAVHKAELHSVLLATRLREFQNYLLTETGHFHEAESRLSKYLITLSSQ